MQMTNGMITIDLAKERPKPRTYMVFQSKARLMVKVNDKGRVTKCSNHQALEGLTVVGFLEYCSKHKWLVREVV